MNFEKQQQKNNLENNNEAPDFEITFSDGKKVTFPHIEKDKKIQLDAILAELKEMQRKYDDLGQKKHKEKKPGGKPNIDIEIASEQHELGGKIMKKQKEIHDLLELDKLGFHALG